MTHKDEKYVINLRRHLRTLPPFGVTFSISLAIILLFSYLFSYVVPYGLFHTIFLFAVPYVGIIFLDFFVFKLLDIYFPLKRISSLNMITFFSALMMFLFLYIFFPFPFAFFLAFSSLIYFRFLIYYVLIHSKKGIATCTSFFYNIIYAGFTFFYYNHYFVPYIAATILYILAAYFGVRMATSRFIREFGENPLWFIASFINYLGRGEGEERFNIDYFFKRIYQVREVPITVFYFWKKDGTLKAAFVFPYVHPGPFGSVGGSDLPNKLEKYTGMKNLIVFHTTTTHDDNIATEEDVKRIAEVIKKNEKDETQHCISRFERFNVGNIVVGAQIFGERAMIALLPIRRIFDDVDIRTGLALRRKLLNFFKDAAVVDGHNNFDEDAVPLILPMKLINKVKNMVKELKCDKPIRMGFASLSLQGKSIGPGGIRAAVFEYGNDTMAYVLLDGNNIKKGLRNKIINALKGVVQDAEIFSTDNHIVNYSFLDLNPVGDKDDETVLIESIVKTVKSAISSIEDVSVSSKTEMVDLHMASRGQLHKLTEITRVSTARSKIMFPVTALMAFILSFLIFLLY